MVAEEDPKRPVSCFFEVRNPTGARLVIDRLGFCDVALFARDAGDMHVAEMETALSTLVAQGASFVLTGKAGTIQRLRRTLKQHGVSSAQLATKAYWTPGKTGMD